MGAKISNRKVLINLKKNRPKVQTKQQNFNNFTKLSNQSSDITCTMVLLTF